MAGRGFYKIDRKIDDWEYLNVPIAYALWNHLIRLANWKDGAEASIGEIAISIRELSAVTGISRNTLTKWLTVFVEVGQISIESAGNKTRIRLLNYGKYNGKGGSNLNQSEKKVAQKMTTSGSNMSHSVEKVAQKRTTGGSNLNHFGESPSLYNGRTEEYIDIKNINNTSSESDAPEIIDNTDAWFREFWKVYPKHKAKTAAEKSFRRKCNTAEDFDTIMTGLRSVIENEWKNRDPQYIPYPTTWLNQERWNDEITPRQKSLDERLMEEHLKNEQGRNNEDPADNPFGVPWD